MTREEWIEAANRIITGYLTRNDGCFDDRMKAELMECDYDAQVITIKFTTQKWQLNEWGGIHGGAIAGMFDTAFGVVADYLAGVNEATTTDMNISFLRGVDFGQHTLVKIFIVKQGRSIIRLRAEMFCEETGKLVATATGNFQPL